MPPADRLTDPHTCPMTTGTVPHLGGPISGSGVPTVLIAGLPATASGDLCVCSRPPDAVAAGSATVLIGVRQAARLGDLTVHGGVIVAGVPNVMIGG